ncbi:hypothetical protein TCAL_07898 [Tigriopus californicus]|uniref:Uncharacterized protein n=1 Tax=Tigriopus californicus TaxID=6832 RepID=A0A553P7D3_TIGCA|nr:hypothetical protein TCAL_07898 [Tigriopus californicus]|eukprot:TCALIF_07900-PA protein Name:"Protein of unknown function" AED:0.26 eAED:0.26 QI:296/1/1/1/1/1/2/122/95
MSYDWTDWLIGIIGVVLITMLLTGLICLYCRCAYTLLTSDRPRNNSTVNATKDTTIPMYGNISRRHTGSSQNMSTMAPIEQSDEVLSENDIISVL